MRADKRGSISNHKLIGVSSRLNDQTVLISQDPGTQMPLSQLVMSEIHRIQLLKSCFLHNQKQLSESRETDHYRESYFHMSCMDPVTFIITLQRPSRFHLSLSLLSFHPSTRTILHIIKISCHSFSVETFLLSLSSEDAKSNF